MRPQYCRGEDPAFRLARSIIVLSLAPYRTDPTQTHRVKISSVHAQEMVKSSAGQIVWFACKTQTNIYHPLRSILPINRRTG